MIIILSIAIMWLILDRAFFYPKDKAARAGLKDLASQMNREMYFYDFIGEAFVPVADFDKEYKKNLEISDFKKELREELEENIDCVEKRIEEVAKASIETDARIAEGTDALARHLKLEIMPYHKPEENGFKVVKLKKKK